MRDFSGDHRWLSLNTATVRKQGDLAEIIEACARHGIRAIDPWRDQVATTGLDRAARQPAHLSVETGPEDRIDNCDGRLRVKRRTYRIFAEQFADRATGAEVIAVRARRVALQIGSAL